MYLDPIDAKLALILSQKLRSVKFGLVADGKTGVSEVTPQNKLMPILTDNCAFFSTNSEGHGFSFSDTLAFEP